MTVPSHVGKGVELTNVAGTFLPQLSVTAAGVGSTALAGQFTEFEPFAGIVTTGGLIVMVCTTLIKSPHASVTRYVLAMDDGQLPVGTSLICVTTVGQSLTIPVTEAIFGAGTADGQATAILAGGLADNGVTVQQVYAEDVGNIQVTGVPFVCSNVALSETFKPETFQ